MYIYIEDFELDTESKNLKNINVQVFVKDERLSGFNHFKSDFWDFGNCIKTRVLFREWLKNFLLKIMSLDGFSHWSNHFLFSKFLSFFKTAFNKAYRKKERVKVLNLLASMILYNFPRKKEGFKKKALSRVKITRKREFKKKHEKFKIPR